MADQIRVLVVDDIPETRDHLTKLLSFESDIDVVGAAASGREALEMATKDSDANAAQAAKRAIARIRAR